MSTPPFVTLPRGVEEISFQGGFGHLAGLIAHPPDAPRGVVLLVPGFTGSKEDFIALIPVLRDLGYLVASYDQRGQYESPGPGDFESYSLSAFAEDVVAVAQQIRPNPDVPVHVVGHSFAGLVVRQAVIDAHRNHTELNFSSLTLLASGPGPVPGELQLMCRQLIDFLPHTSLEEIWHIKEEVDQGDSRVPADDSVYQFLRKRFVSNNPYALAAKAQILIEVALDVPLLKQAATQLGLPILVSFGDQDDRWTPAEQIQMAADLECRHVIFDGLAHSPAAEDPHRTATAFEAYFTDVAGTSVRAIEFGQATPGYTRGMELSTTVVSDPKAVSSTRKTLMRQLQAWGLDHLADDLQLISSELVTNAMRYSKGPIKVRLKIRGSRVRVEVTDSNPDEVPEALDAGETLSHGRGLPLIDAIAASWGVVKHSKSKTVWAELKVA